jgi:hypothetical protein
MLKAMAVIAAECAKAPGKYSVWSPEVNKYVCSDTEEGKRAIALLSQPSSKESSTHPPINPTFKLVFLTAAGGTVLFVVLCFVLTLSAGRDLPSLAEKVVMAFFDLAKIGFGAVVGLLGGQSLQSVRRRDAADEASTPAHKQARTNKKPSTEG